MLTRIQFFFSLLYLFFQEVRQAAELLEISHFGNILPTPNSQTETLIENQNIHLYSTVSNTTIISHVRYDYILTDIPLCIVLLRSISK